MDISQNYKHLKQSNYLVAQKSNREKVPSIEVAEVVLVQCNLVDNQYQQKSEVLYTFAPNKSYAYLLNVELSYLVFQKTFNTEFDVVVIKFTDQNGRLLEIEDQVNLTLLINKYTRSLSLEMRRYSTEARTRQYVRGYGFLSFARKI